MSENTKKDGGTYRTYRSWLKQEFWYDRQPSYVVIKELSKPQTAVYETLSHMCIPNLETVYGVMEDCDRCYAINEYILPPAALRRIGSDGDPDHSLSLETFVCEYNCSLDRQPLPFKQRVRLALVLTLQLCEALEAIHAKGFNHGDVHPGNILITDAPDWYKLIQSVDCDLCFKLIDFDNAQNPKDSDHTVTRLLGTKLFSAPEILDFSHPTDRTDIYSLGCILYYTIYGKSPKEYLPDKKNLPGRQIHQIFRRCTAGYETRYRNIKSLKKDLMAALRNLSPAMSILSRFPGFRSHTLWKTLAAVFFYSVIFVITAEAIEQSLMTGLPMQAEQKEDLFISSFLLTEILAVFDVFHLGDRFKSYAYIKTIYPAIAYFVKFVVFLLILVGFALLGS